jgi:glycosyltransferase involved in cell wall biosynthesis
MPSPWQEKTLTWPLKYLWTQIRLSWEMFFSPPDVLFVPAHALPLFCRTKTVITLHDLGFKRFPAAYSFWQRNYPRFVYRWAAKFASKIIVPSEFTKNELIDLYKINPQKVEVVYLGYNNNLFRPINERERVDQVLNQYKIKKPYLLYVGRLEKKKNIDNLIRVFQKIVGITTAAAELNLVLIGRFGYGSQKIASKIKGDQLIRQFDYIISDDLPYFYAGAECFVFPSLYEGFGLPVLEAMACGCPVVTSQSLSLLEIGDGAIQCFNAQNIEEGVRIILKIMRDRELRGEMIRRGLERAQNFSWQKCAQETIKILLSRD